MEARKALICRESSPLHHGPSTLRRGVTTIINSEIDDISPDIWSSLRPILQIEEAAVVKSGFSSMTGMRFAVRSSAGEISIVEESHPRIRAGSTTEPDKLGKYRIIPYIMPGDILSDTGRLILLSPDAIC